MNETIVISAGPNRLARLLRPVPRASADIYGNYCDSYQHIGQHCAAITTAALPPATRPVPRNYRDLFEELERRATT